MADNQNREYSIPHMMNMSYHKKFQQNTVEVLKYDPSSDSLVSDIADGTLELFVDKVSASVLYICEAPAGTATDAIGWRIRRIDTVNPITIKYADGSTAFNKVCDDRATYTY